MEPATNRGLIVSFPRDLLVRHPGRGGLHRINEAFDIQDYQGDDVRVYTRTLEEITEALGASIPTRGTLVTPSPVPALWSRRAPLLGTEVRTVSSDEVRTLPAGYIEWPINVALALEVCAVIDTGFTGERRGRAAGR